MDASFWHEKWELDHIAFHKNAINPLLLNHIEKLQLEKHARIFLPLCGKTLDIAYLLKRDFKIVGIDLSEIAITALYEEMALTPEVSTVGDFTLYKAKNIEIYVGDIFDLTAEILGNIDATYDRAALIALPQEIRQRYSKHLNTITNNAKQLLICLEYDQSIMDGPPFSVTPAELNTHYAEQFKLECVQSDFSEDGLKGKHPATESVWLLNAK